MIHHLYEINYLLYIFMICGVITSSISGALRAIESKMDITGAILLAFLTSNAGGTIRDIILGTTVFWIKDQFYIWITLIIGSLSFIIVYFEKQVIGRKKIHTILIVTDAMGLAAFSLAGVEKSLVMGQNDITAILMGVWTAIGGGIIADIISNRIPLVFSQELYITVAFFGAICYLTLINFSVIHSFASVIAALLMILLRLYSVKYKWKFPIIP